MADIAQQVSFADRIEAIAIGLVDTDHDAAYELSELANELRDAGGYALGTQTDAVPSPQAALALGRVIEGAIMLPGQYVSVSRASYGLPDDYLSFVVTDGMGGTRLVGGIAPDGRVST